MLEHIRESVSLAGYSAAFDELTAPLDLDRLLLAIVLQLYSAIVGWPDVRRFWWRFKYRTIPCISQEEKLPTSPSRSA